MLNPYRSLSLPSQLLMRNAEIILANKILIIGLPETLPLMELEKVKCNKEITIFEYDYSSFRHLKSIHKDTHYGDWIEAGKTKYDLILLYLPNTAELVSMMISMCALLLNNETDDAKFYIIGEKNSGIKSAEAEIEQLIGKVNYTDFARHSRIYGANFTPKKLQTIISNTQLYNWQSIYNENVGEIKMEITSLPGVFSHGKIDEGTKLLLNSLDDPQMKRVHRALDWGCGSGVIGTYIKLRWPDINLDMADSNAMAISSARLTVENNGIGPVMVIPTDIFSDLPDKYDLIISNPPFHKGVGTDYTIVEKFISESYNHLEPHGKIRIVANTFLRYKPLLQKRFDNCRTVTSNNKYSIYESVKSILNLSLSSTSIVI